MKIMKFGGTSVGKPERMHEVAKLIIKDEGGYFPKRDEKILSTRMDFIDSAIATMKDVFENGEFPGDGDQCADDRVGLERAISALRRAAADERIQPHPGSTASRTVRGRDRSVRHAPNTPAPI